jgi:poly-gamma-glutamate synthesis protein (capsule biosynthesis protein)
MGDVMVGRLVNEHLSRVPSTYLWGDALPLIKSLDVRVINLEAALTRSELAVPKVFNFKADPDKVQSLIDAEIDVANLANNHILDYSEEGLYETIATLDKAGIKHIGAGKNAAEARKPVIIECKRIKLGILGYTDNEPTWKATSTKPGTNYIKIGDIQAVEKDVTPLRNEVDFIIVSIHWGPNMREYPSKEFVQFAHEMIDAGVDIVHGHSAHIFQGIEYYKNKLILYDTGDFVDDYYVDPFLRNDRSFLFIVEVDRSGIKELRLVPILISNFQVNLAEGEDADWSIKRMEKLSKALKYTHPNR